MKYPDSQSQIIPEPTDQVVEAGPTLEEWNTLTPEQKKAWRDLMFPGASPERREQRMCLSEHALLALFLHRFRTVDVRLDFPELPEDVKVECVAHDPLMRCWWVYVSHPSFAVVPPGSYAPQIPCVWREVRWTGAEETAPEWKYRYDRRGD